MATQLVTQWVYMSLKKSQIQNEFCLWGIQVYLLSVCVRVLGLWIKYDIDGIIHPIEFGGFLIYFILFQTKTKTYILWTFQFKSPKYCLIISNLTCMGHPPCYCEFTSYLPKKKSQKTLKYTHTSTLFFFCGEKVPKFVFIWYIYPKPISVWHIFLFLFLFCDKKKSHMHTYVIHLS